VFDQFVVPLKLTAVSLVSFPDPESKLNTYCDKPFESAHFVAKTDGIPALGDVTPKFEYVGGSDLAVALTPCEPWAPKGTTEDRKKTIIRLTPKRRASKPDDSLFHKDDIINLRSCSPEMARSVPLSQWSRTTGG
jgi:hypothetical protein